MPKYEVTLTYWGPGSASATVVVEAPDRKAATAAARKEVKEEDWSYDVDHDDGGVYIKETR